MFLCQSGDGFNFTTSRAIGYPWLLEYLAGDVHNQTDSGVCKRHSCKNATLKVTKHNILFVEKD